LKETPKVRWWKIILMMVRNTYKILVGKPKVKRQLLRPVIKVGHKETGCESVDWV
jgi:hypothetical protein